MNYGEKDWQPHLRHSPTVDLWGKRNSASMARMPQEPKWWQLWTRWATRLRSEN